jgi:regulator of ribonuclease activity A
MLGDLLAAKAAANGWSGVLMYGLIRDSVEIAAMDLGVKALGTHPMKSVKNGVGERDLVVRFGGVTFVPGEYLYADEDGIVCSADALLP